MSSRAASPRPHQRSFRAQLGSRLDVGRRNFVRTASLDEKVALAGAVDDATAEIAAPFASQFKPREMRQLALVAHNHMKPAMRDFIATYSEILQKFRITGTQTTMRMCKTLWGEDNPAIEYGLTCTSGPLGGDAQVAALMCVEDLGALIFFIDPLSAHPHQADIDSLGRLSNCGNIVVCNNPTSAMSLMHTLKCALERGHKGMIPSFFETLESPAVAEYKRQQEVALESAVASITSGASAGAGAGRPDHGVQDSVALLSTDILTELEVREEDDDDGDSDFDTEEALEAIEELRGSIVTSQRKSSWESARPGGAERRASQNLTGIKIPPKKKKPNTRKKLLKSLGKSVRRMNSKNKMAPGK